MGWYSFIALMSDWRVQFLIGFVFVAIVVAIILTLIEIKLKRKKEVRIAVKVVDNSPVGKMKRFLEFDKTSREKLDFINHVSKTYFRETYGTSLSFSYSALVRKLERDKNSHEDEVVFCKYMFAAYYSQKDLTDGEVRTLGKMLVNIENKRPRKKVVKEVSFGERVGKFLKSNRVSKKSLPVSRSGKFENKMVNVKKVEDKRKEMLIAEIQKEALEDARKERDLKIAQAKLLKEDEESREYEKQKVIPEKTEGKISGGGFEKLKVSWGDFIRRVKSPRVKSHTPRTNLEIVVEDSVGRGNEGVAERIIRKEKDRLGEMGVFVE